MFQKIKILNLFCMVFKKKIIDERILVNKDYFKDKSGSLDTNII